MNTEKKSFYQYKDTPQELLDTLVQVENNTSFFSTIVSVTKSTFKIKGNDMLFNISTGRQRGASPYTGYRCTIVTEAYKLETEKRWVIANEILHLRNFIKSEIASLSIGKLSLISDIIKSKNEKL